MRRLACLALVGLLVTGGCGGGSSSAGATKVLGRTDVHRAVEGVVRRHGAVVVGARVELGSSSTVTDASGSYRFDGIEPGSYRVVVVDTGDDSPVCADDGACITAESARHATVDIVVGDEPVRADVDL